MSGDTVSMSDKENLLVSVGTTPNPEVVYQKSTAC